MRLAVLGATGGIGGHVLTRALGAGYTVHALARRPGALPPAAGLAVTRGDALDGGAVADVIAEADVVVSALGPRGAASPSLLAGAAANMVAAMEKSGTRRLICVSAAGAFVGGDPHASRLVKVILPRVLARQFADTRQMEDLVRRTDLDWTMVRPTRLTDRPVTGRYRVSPDYPARGGWKIARADVAHFIAGLLAEGGWVRSAPALAY
jgi:putative NADH-flavin reductase